MFGTFKLCNSWLFENCSDVKDHNLNATGRSRKEWIHYTVADDVWGHRPIATAKVTDTDAAVSEWQKIHFFCNTYTLFDGL